MRTSTAMAAFTTFAILILPQAIAGQPGKGGKPEKPTDDSASGPPVMIYKDGGRKSTSLFVSRRDGSNPQAVFTRNQSMGWALYDARQNEALVVDGQNVILVRWSLDGDAVVGLSEQTIFSGPGFPFCGALSNAGDEIAIFESRESGGIIHKIPRATNGNALTNPADWESVALTDKTAFFLSCRYRFDDARLYVGHQRNEFETPGDQNSQLVASYGSIRSIDFGASEWTALTNEKQFVDYFEIDASADSNEVFYEEAANIYKASESAPPSMVVDGRAVKADCTGDEIIVSRPGRRNDETVFVNLDDGEIPFLTGVNRPDYLC